MLPDIMEGLVDVQVVGVQPLKPSENPRRVDLRGVSRIRVYRGLAEIS